jgi:hypothetical protein
MEMMKKYFLSTLAKSMFFTLMAKGNFDQQKNLRNSGMDLGSVVMDNKKFSVILMTA